MALDSALRESGGWLRTGSACSMYIAQISIFSLALRAQLTATPRRQRSKCTRSSEKLRIIYQNKLPKPDLTSDYVLKSKSTPDCANARQSSTSR